VNMETMNLAVGDTVELQNDLRPTDVEIINGNVVSVLHDETAEQTTYERRFKRSTAPKNASIELPDDAVVAAFDGSEVHFFVGV